MIITREETPSGGDNRTPREEIRPLNTTGREVEPEAYIDASPSEGWPWNSDPGKCTWLIQKDTFREFLAPFAILDSQEASEQADGSDEKGGVYAYPFSDRFWPIGEGPDDGDLNESNWERKWAAFNQKHFDGQDRPGQYGGTVIMSAITAGDTHFMGEFGSDPVDERPVRARVVLTDGALQDDKQFRAYLSQATLDSSTGYGQHGEWEEVWAIGIVGDLDDAGGKAAYDQWTVLAKDHPWVHVYYFEGVKNPREIAEDLALAVVPTHT